eukprot:scaffold67400_cov33-Prasinocladus_malaysianus.AAC.1
MQQERLLLGNVSKAHQWWFQGNRHLGQQPPRAQGHVLIFSNKRFRRAVRRNNRTRGQVRPSLVGVDPLA